MESSVSLPQNFGRRFLASSASSSLVPNTSKQPDDLEEDETAEERAKHALRPLELPRPSLPPSLFLLLSPSLHF